MTHDFTGAGERTVADLHRAVRAIGRHFETDTVIVIGSQVILVGGRWTRLAAARPGPQIARQARAFLDTL